MLNHLYRPPISEHFILLCFRTPPLVPRGNGLQTCALGRSKATDITIKKNSGRTVNQKLTELRMERAKTLLADPSRKLYEVAHAVGYADGKYFVKLFTKEVGIPPRLYRENLCCHEE